MHRYDNVFQWLYIVFIVNVVTAHSAVSATASQSTAWLGNEACTNCHHIETQDWLGSHHDLAMQVASPDTVLGDFNDARFEYAGITTRFFTDQEGYWVETDNAAGTLERFKVAYVFGVYPLQQLLLPLPGGRLQALTIAWDSRPRSEGGQRWYHLYPDDAIRAGDPLHWTGPYQNWNSRCAECHSTDVRKNYDPNRDSFDTRYAQIDVGCEACHGPGRDHVRLAREGKLSEVAGSGLTHRLAGRGTWAFEDNASIARRTDSLGNTNQIDSCARCHARRSTLGDYHYGADLLDTHRLATLEAPLYWPDGQIRDEVYVYGSFVQSKMHQAGVVCSNCHNPHSGALLAEGNALCSQCHRPSIYDKPSHHFHEAGSSGAQCVNCHMPAQRYMGVDWRRDHSMRIPRPDISLATGAPNACSQCHEGKSADWALKAIRQWGVTLPRDGQAIALHRAQQNDIGSIPALRNIIRDDAVAPIVRATATTLYGALSPPDLAATLAPLLQSEYALIRASAVRATAALPHQQRFLMLRVLVDDPVLTVRMAVAEQLAAVPETALRAQDLVQLDPLFSEYEAIQAQHLDMPSVRAQLASYWRDRGNTAQAAAELEQALIINPQLESARLNQADLLRATGDDNAARQSLLEGLKLNEQSGNLHYALGLLNVRAGQRALALEYLKRAAELETDGNQHRYVYAIALHDSGQPEPAIAVLERLNNERPGDPATLQALIGYCEELGRSDCAYRYRQALHMLMSGLR